MLVVSFLSSRFRATAVRGAAALAGCALAASSLLASVTPAAAETTPAVSSQAVEGVFVGGSAAVESMWSSGNTHPSYNSAYRALVEGFSPEPTSYSYQWLRDGGAIAGASADTYLSTPTDVGRRISVRVTAHGTDMTPRAVTSTPFTVRARDTMHVDYGLSFVGSRWDGNFCYCTSTDGEAAGIPGSGRAAQALIARPASESYVTSPVPGGEADEMRSSFWFETTGFVSGRGWRPMTSASGIYYVGSIGENRRLEAFRIKPGGPHASFYDVWYRAYVPSYGWLGWARNGESAGTTGFGLRIESVQIKVLPRGTRAAASGSGNAPYYDKGTQKQITVRTYFRPSGWKPLVVGGATAGYPGTSQRLNALRVNVDGSYTGGAQVSAKVQGAWRPYVGNNHVAGTYHSTNNASAYRMRLTGEMSTRYDIYYRVHVAGTGWLGWARNGAAAGAASYKARNTAVQVVLVKKGERALMSANGRAAYTY